MKKFTSFFITKSLVLFTYGILNRQTINVDGEIHRKPVLEKRMTKINNGGSTGLSS